MSIAEVFIVAVLYAQLINVYESIKWTGGLWRLEPPFPVAENKVPLDFYHIKLAFLYFIPFPAIALDVSLCVLGGFMVWLFNDITWHFWSVKPRYWLEWIKFYFNPRGREVVWYARFGVIATAVTPRRMLMLTLFRMAILTLLIIFIGA